MLQQVESVERILAELNLLEIPSLLVLNKTDLIEKDALETIINQLSQEGRREVVAISALQPASLKPLLDRVGSLLARDLMATADSQPLFRTA